MTTIAELSETLADALGVNRRHLRWIADELHGAGEMALADETATPADAASLLIALGGSLHLEHPRITLAKFADLPVVSIRQTTAFTAQGTGEYWEPEDDSLFVQFVNDCAGYGVFLAEIIEAYVEAAPFSVRPGDISFVSLPGQTTVLTEIYEVEVEGGGGVIGGARVTFGTGEPSPPDDAAPCRIQRVNVVPAAIFDVLRHALAGKAEPPNVVTDSDTPEPPAAGVV